MLIGESEWMRIVCVCVFTFSHVFRILGLTLYKDMCLIEYNKILVCDMYMSEIQFADMILRLYRWLADRTGYIQIHSIHYLNFYSIVKHQIEQVQRRCLAQYHTYSVESQHSYVRDICVGICFADAVRSYRIILCEVTMQAAQLRIFVFFQLAILLSLF